MPPIIGVPMHIHGLTVDGTQGIGVNTPSAAAVAEATVGFAIDVQRPQGATLVIGAMSCMVAAKAPAIMTLV